jgi:endonuclease YncB( thermonuclease family)
MRNGVVQCDPKGHDRYGTVIAVCWAGGENLNVWMVSEGWALAYRRYSSDFVLSEVAASTLNRGIWRGDFVPTWDWRRENRI